jgi:hypothetical protein
VLCLRGILIFFIYLKEKREAVMDMEVPILLGSYEVQEQPWVHGLQRASLGTPQKPTTLTRTSPTITYLVPKAYREANNIVSK